LNKSFWVAGIAVATLLPSMAFAQDRCEQQRDQRTTAGTIIGGIAGAVVGGNVADRKNRTEGAVLGGVVGAVAGNAIARSSADCDRAYGYYDSNGLWHANDRQVGRASGYFDRDGRFIEGQPDGYYDNGRWVEARGAGGYADRDGRWVPAAANGYYDSRGQWVAGTSAGHYENGRWVSGPAQGYYDRNGRWVRGEAPGRRDANGVWVADAQPGYYDNGRWVAGETRGYYDSQGRWMRVGTVTQAYASDTRGYDRGRESWSGADTRRRASMLGDFIRTARQDGQLTKRESRNALTTLADISRSDEQMRRRNNGRLGPRGMSAINARLDSLARTVRMDVRDDRYPANYRRQ
jgi:hypothetical protein